MVIFKRIWLWLLGFSLLSIVNFSHGLSNWPALPGINWDSTPTVGAEEVKSIEQWSDKFSDKLSWILHFPEKEDYETSLKYVVALIKIIVNWTLWILSFLALIYILYSGFLVFSAWTDDKKASSGKKWIKNALIALAWIGLAWLIVSAMLRFINSIAWGVWGAE